MQKIKEKLHIGKNKQHDEYGHESNSSLREDIVERPVATGVAEVPIVVTEQERVGHHSHRGGVVGEHHRGGVVGEHRALGVGEEVCGTKTFTEVEDRPVVKERVERILEHNPVEKQYVVETRFVGEVPITSAAGATVIDTSERIVEAAAPGARCPANAGQIMDGVIGGMGSGHHHGLGRDRV